MQRIAVDQYHIDQFLDAVNGLTCPTEPGTIEILDLKQVAQVQAAIIHVQQWLEAHQ